MAQRYTKEQYDKMKDESMLKLVLHMRDPEHFGSPKVTLDDVAVLQSKDCDSVLSRMSICKAEGTALMKLKNELGRMGITGIADLIAASSPGPTVTYGAV